MGDTVLDNKRIPHRRLNQYGPRNHQWRGGRKKDRYGYWLVLSPGHRGGSKGYIFEHVLVYEQYHKCCVLPWTNIHHINHKKDDNRIENLMGLTKSQHQRYHATKDLTSRRCIDCGSNKTYVAARGVAYWHLSKNGDGWVCDRCRGQRRKLQREIFATRKYFHVPTE